MHPAITICLRAGTAALSMPTLAQWQPAWQQLVTEGLGEPQEPMALALRGGHAADRLAWAFAAGYQAALRCLLPDVAPHELMGLCLTESTGKRPRELHCTAARQADGRWLLQGHKSWAAFGPACTTLLVIARDGDAAQAAMESPRLLALRVPHDAPGVRLSSKPATPLIPELPHGRLDLPGALLPAHACLKGDGYADYGKPFAVLEDLHVGAAVLAYLLREARARQWPGALREQLVAAMALLATLAESPPHDDAMHVALAAALAWARQLHADAAAAWAATPDDPAAQRWQRDAPLLGLAGASRAQRAARAWERLAAGD